MTGLARWAGLALLAAVAATPVRQARAQGVGSPAAAAQPSLVQELNLSGSLRTGFWSTSRSLDGSTDLIGSSVWLKGRRNLGNGFYAAGEGWLMDERLLNGGARQRGELREVYLGWHNDRLEINVGRKILNWGRADWFNPTDVLSSRDYTLLFQDDGDLRRTNLVASAAYSFSDITATVLWAPEFRANLYPLATTPGLLVMQGADRFNANQFALRVDRTGGDIDWSLTYFNGFDHDPGAGVALSTAVGQTVTAVYNRMQMWGADFATNIGSFGLRGEIAYKLPSAGLSGNIFNPRPTLEAVFGLDHPLGEHWTINGQYIIHQTFAFSPVSGPASGGQVAEAVATKAALLNNQLRAFQHGPSLRITYSAWNDTLQLEALGAAFFSDGGYYVRLRGTYAITDQIKASIGADFFEGPARSYFGQLRHASGFLSQIRYEF